MKLAKALKTKNQLVAKLKATYQHLAKENSVSSTTIRAYDPGQLAQEIEALTGKLIELKTKIAVANTAVMPIIIEMAELKNAIMCWKQVDCTNGEMNDRFSSRANPAIHISFYSQVIVDNKIASCEEAIQNLQDKLDEHNHSVEIDFAL